MVTSFWATGFNVVFGLFAAYVLSKYNFWGRNALIVTISLPTAIPTAVAGFALLLLWGPYGTLGRLMSADHQIMFTACDMHYTGRISDNAIEGVAQTSTGFHATR